MTRLLLIARKENPYAEATNGIAYDEKKDKVLVTGKFWPYIFRSDSNIKNNYSS